MIINSLLDNDLYKFTMQQVVFHKFSNVPVEYVFTNRSKANLQPYFEQIKAEIYHLENLTLSQSEVEFLKKLTFLKPDYVEFLSNMRLNPRKYVHIWLNNDNELQIRLKGGWLHTILFEVPILAIISETICRAQKNKQGLNSNDIVESALRKLQEKAALVNKTNGFKFADFGTRRRFSLELHNIIVENCKKWFGNAFVGTSNVRLAMLHGLKPIGTMAHEYLMAHQQIYNLKGHQLKALNNWSDEYQGQLGVVLTDTLTTDVFLNDFHLGHAKLFDGVRQDSGDPYEVCEKFIAHYKKLGIAPLTKSIVFSDSLNFPKAVKLYEHFKGQIGISFGIGTNLCNDIENIKAPSIVIKLAAVYGLPVAKISDSQGKELCENDHYLKYLKEVEHISYSG